MFLNTQNLWRIDRSPTGNWKVLYFQGDKRFDCGSPTRPEVTLAMLLEFVEHNAQRYDMVSICGALFQIGRTTRV